MAPTDKTISIDFFTFGKAQDSEFDISEFLSRCASEGHGSAWESGPYVYELREMSQSGAVVKGVFAKIRGDELPHAGEPGGYERELDLAEREGIIEKNFFIYRIRDGLLIYHKNGHGSRESKLAKYVSAFGDETVTLNPVLQAEPAARLMRGDVHPLSLTVSFAKPTHPDMYPDNDWDNSLLSVLNSAGGANVALRLTSDRRSADADKRRLSDRVKSAATAFAESGLARVVRLDVLDDGIEHPIDLIADRIKSRKVIRMDGRYPNKQSIYTALAEAFSDERESIYEVIGVPGQRVD